jgi:ribosomal protein L7/L12
MTNQVEDILNLFDNLDAYEAIELVQSLRERGYFLTTARLSSNETDIWEEKPDRKQVGIVLKEYDEQYKIYAIKKIRELVREQPFKGLDLQYASWGLKECKDYTELYPIERKKYTFCTGPKEDILRVLGLLNADYKSAKFESVPVNELDPNKFWKEVVI